MNKEELITQLQNGNVGIRIEDEEEGEYLISWMKKNDVIYINDDYASGSNIEHGDIIGVTECCGKYVWDFEEENEMKLVITFDRFKEIIESKVDPPTTRTDNKYPGNPFNSLKTKRSPLHLYSIEELENELERRRNQKLKALENTINTAFEELISMGYKIHNVYSEDNMDGEVNISIEKKEILIS